MALELYVLTGIVGRCSFEDLNDAEQLQRLLEQSAKEASMAVLETRMKRFDPFGVTGVTILSQSHIAVHTWPEMGKLFIDIATCSTAESAEKVMGVIVAAFPGAVVESQHRFMETSSPQET